MNPNKLLLAIAITGWITITAHAQSFLTNGLVAFYPFKGNANDVVGTNNGVIYGGVTLAPDRFGSNNSAYLFNGVDGYIDIGSPIGDAPVDFTETAWVDIISRATNGVFAEDVIITKRQGPSMYDGESWVDLVVESSGSDAGAGELIADASDYFAQYPGTTITPTNVWFFLGEVCTNNTYQLYVNGSLENTIAGSFPISSPEDMTLMHEGAWGTFSHGMLDDVRIYNRPLSSNEMEWLYASEAPPQAATATATLINDFVVGTTIIDGGAGYTNTPLVRIIGGGGSGAQAVAVVTNGVVLAINMIDAGAGYTNTPVVVVDPPFIPNPVLGVAPVSLLNFSNLIAGDSYQLQQFNSWYWTNLPVSFTATNSVYQSLLPPAEYRLALNPPPTQAFATPEVVNGFVVGTTVTAGGSGYVTAPVVNIVGDVGSNAIAVADISGGAVTNVSIEDPGAGYTNLVTVEIAPPPTTALYPTIFPVIQVNSSGLAPYDNYQLEYKPEIGAPWQNWSVGLLSSTNAFGSQYIVPTNSAGFFRLEYVP